MDSKSTVIRDELRMKGIFQIIRPVNILLIILVQCLIKFGLIDRILEHSALSGIQFLMLVVATAAIAAAGNVINDIFDQEIDAINKPAKQIVGKSLSEI